MKNYKDLLGGIETDSSGKIVKAKAITNIWWVNINFSTVDMDKVGNMAGTADWVQSIPNCQHYACKLTIHFRHLKKP